MALALMATGHSVSVVYFRNVKNYVVGYSMQYFTEHWVQNGVLSQQNIDEIQETITPAITPCGDWRQASSSQLGAAVWALLKKAEFE